MKSLPAFALVMAAVVLRTPSPVYAESPAAPSLEEQQQADSDLRAKTMSAQMALMQAIFEASERDSKEGGLTACVTEGTARLEEIGESEQYATHALTPGPLFRRESPGPSDFATAIFIRKSVLARYQSAREKLEACVAKAGNVVQHSR